MRVLVVLAAMAASVAAQSRIVPPPAETRRLAQPLTREIETIAARRTPAWIGYRTAAVPSGRQSCNAPLPLEPSKEMIVLARVGPSGIERLRTFSPDCEIETGDVPLTWLEGVSPDESASWLSTFVQPASSANRPDSLVQPALAALGLTPGPAALRTLVGLARDDSRTTIRTRALNALAERAEQEASATIQNAIANDPDGEVKKTAVGALARMPKDEGVPLLIQIARTNRNVDVRKQAMFWLGQSKDPRAVSFFEEILSK
jgi:hypothetical protein